MQKNKVSKSEISATKRQFSTIDDALEIIPKIEKLTRILKELGQRKHPLAVRKGGSVNTAKAKRSVPIKGGSSTYFLDVREAKTGSKYLKITQSRKANGDNKLGSSSVCIFPEDAKEFFNKVAEMITELK